MLAGFLPLLVLWAKTHNNRANPSDCEPSYLLATALPFLPRDEPVREAGNSALTIHTIWVGGELPSDARTGLRFLRSHLTTKLAASNKLSFWLWSMPGNEEYDDAPHQASQECQEVDPTAAAVTLRRVLTRRRAPVPIAPSLKKMGGKQRTQSTNSLGLPVALAVEEKTFTLLHGNSTVC